MSAATAPIAAGTLRQCRVRFQRFKEPIKTAERFLLETGRVATGGACIRLLLPLAGPVRPPPEGAPVGLHTPEASHAAPVGAGTLGTDPPAETPGAERSGTAGYAGDLDADRFDPAH